jgi:hypothetical protein
MPVAELEPVYRADLALLAMGPQEQLFGHVTLVQAYSTASDGAYCLVALRDEPRTVAVLTSKPNLQSVMELALCTGHLVTFTGRKYQTPPTPLGGTWAVDVYSPKSFTVYGT